MRFSEGDFVRDTRCGRNGLVRRLVPPGHDGRVYYVEWEGSVDFSLMGDDELERGPPFIQTHVSLWLLDPESGSDGIDFDTRNDLAE